MMLVLLIYHRNYFVLLFGFEQYMYFHGRRRRMDNLAATRKNLRVGQPSRQVVQYLVPKLSYKWGLPLIITSGTLSAFSKPIEGAMYSFFETQHSLETADMCVGKSPLQQTTVIL
jgi:hypothetical protein